ncbi:retropepsin-like aspartic protease family protein [Alteromonas sp. ASW11-130]|uniref:retropepsin-like aspartic protease family protein n=1 Tax=Alteromonas sp. ASW11-130 TaxID=3015775 RepID=UPI0022421482|nr:retropepsin-like aspartic protease [Alteromonas sp. ASW11-130]MCW8092571.1 retroviral-like aspartic protease family protein [Alteromonas sp. ASW11-130]
MKFILILALIISVTANVWLYRQWQGNAISTAVAPPFVNSGPGHTPLDDDSSANTTQLSVNTSSLDGLDVEALQSLLAEGKLSELRYKLQLKLREQPDNIELLLLEAELMMKTEPLNEALLHYYTLLRRPLDDKIRERIQQRVVHLLRETIHELEQTQSWELLAQFLEPLFQQLPTNKQIVLALAEAYGQQQKFTLMEDTLAALSAQDAQATSLRQRLRKTETPQPEEFPQMGDFNQTTYQSIPLQRLGDHYLVNVAFGPITTKLIIDTGASTTSVTRQVMDAIAEQQDTIRIGIFNMRTAGGEIDSEMNQVFGVLVGDFSFPELNVMTLPNGSMAHADGLLGMNVLRHFEFRIDQQRSLLWLKLNNSRS